jgi:hypothetical protein
MFLLAFIDNFIFLLFLHNNIPLYILITFGLIKDMIMNSGFGAWAMVDCVAYSILFSSRQFIKDHGFLPSFLIFSVFFFLKTFLYAYLLKGRFVNICPYYVSNLLLFYFNYKYNAFKKPLLK